MLVNQWVLEKYSKKYGQMRSFFCEFLWKDRSITGLFLIVRKTKFHPVATAVWDWFARDFLQYVPEEDDRFLQEFRLSRIRFAF